MDFSVFDTKKIDEYSRRAREQWGHTEVYREFTENIDRAGGEGTAEFTARAIEYYCDNRASR